MTSLRIIANSSNSALRELESCLGSSLVRFEKTGYNCNAYEGFRAVGAYGGVWYVSGDFLSRVIGSGWNLAGINEIIIEHDNINNGSYGGRYQPSTQTPQYSMAEATTYKWSYDPGYQNTNDLHSTIAEQQRAIDRLKKAVVENGYDAIRVMPTKSKSAKRKVMWNRVHKQHKK